MLAWDWFSAVTASVTAVVRAPGPSQLLCWVKWVEVSFSPVPPISRALGHCAPDNTWKALSTQECPPAQPTARLHVDSWQPAQADKLIRPNLSMARSERVLPQISLQLPFCTHGPQEAQGQPGSWLGPTPAGSMGAVGASFQKEYCVS